MDQPDTHLQFTFIGFVLGLRKTHFLAVIISILAWDMILKCEKHLVLYRTNMSVLCGRKISIKVSEEHELYSNSQTKHGNGGQLLMVFIIHLV